MGLFCKETESSAGAVVQQLEEVRLVVKKQK